MSEAYIRWDEEEVPVSGGIRRVYAAWLVRDVTDGRGHRQEVLAYLGEQPSVTPALQEEVAALYPHVSFDWDALRRACARRPGAHDVTALTDDDLMLMLRPLAHERGLTLMDLALRLGYRQRQILPEVVRLLESDPNVARFERTAGSIFEYLMAQHLEYAFLVYKARLYFEGDERTLDEVIAAEPRGFSDAAWRARRRFWQERLDAYRRSRVHHARESPPTAH